MKKILALVLALAMCLAAVACTGAKAATEEQRAASAVTVGDIEIPCGDIQDYYEYIVQMYSAYGMAVPTADEDIDTIVESCMETYIEEALMTYEAKKMGVDKLTKEQEQAVQAELAEDRESLVESYAASLELPENASAEEREAAAVAAINNDLTEYYGYEMTFDQYMELRAETLRASYYSDNVRQAVKDSASVTEDDVRATYEKYLAVDKAAAEQDPASYVSNQESAEMFGSRTILFVPENCLRVKTVTVWPEETLSTDYSEKLEAMDALAEEYGKMMLSGASDEARAEEIRTQYAALGAETEAMYTAVMAPAMEKANAAYAELQSGADIDAVMEKYNEDSVFAIEAFKNKGRLMYMGGGAESEWSDEIRSAAAKLEPGTYSEPFESNGSIVIVYLVGMEPAGEKSIASVAEEYAVLARTEHQDTVWNETLEGWMNDSSIVVRHPENYRYIGREA